MSDNSGDLFHFKINYNNLESGSGATALYNGNIAQTFWQTKHDNEDVRGYDYSYDNLNRISGANGLLGTNLSILTPSTIFDVSGIGYDKNGNILALSRNGNDNNANPQAGVWDNLVYSYANNSNQLVQVSDNNTDISHRDFGFKDDGSPFNDYTYDANGNMTGDTNKGITLIEYNHLNLPTRIEFASQTQTDSISYVYDATGVKLEKTVSNISENNTSTTEYAGNYMYTGGNLQFFNHPEGYIEPVAGTTKSVKGFDGGSGNTTYSSYQYVFQYKDHLGNVRLSYADADLDGAIDPTSEIVEESNYYPFGLKQKGYNNVIAGGNSLAQAWSFLGQERIDDLGLNWLTFRYRNYMPDIGRFFGSDPITEEFLSISNYQFAHNSPVWKIELEGLEGEALTGFDNQNFEPISGNTHVGSSSIPIGDGTGNHGNTHTTIGTGIVQGAGDVGVGLITPQSMVFVEAANGNGLPLLETVAPGVRILNSVMDGSDAVAEGDEGAVAQIATREGLSVAISTIGALFGAKFGGRSAGKSNKSGASVKDGIIYEVPGEATSSGKPYVGRTKQGSAAKRGRGAKDGRDRTQAKEIDRYDSNNGKEGSYREQKAINERGGKNNLDNVRDEMSKKNYDEAKKKHGTGG